VTEASPPRGGALAGTVALALLLPACSSTFESAEGVQITVPSGVDSEVSVEDGSADPETIVPPCTDDRAWTAGADPTTNYVDFVKLGTSEFINAEHNAGVLDEPDLGPVVAEVCLRLSEITFTEPFDIEAGDAAYLLPGTEIREIVGADPALRVGTVVDGRVLIYEVWDRPDALVGGQLLDLGANIDEISVGADGGKNVLASITESEAVEALLGAVRTAPVDRSRPPGPPAIEPEYLVEFHRSDGTTTRRGYRPASGWLEPSIFLPEEARLLLLGLIAEADPEIAASATSTTTPDTTATTGTTQAPPSHGETTADDGDDSGFIPEPENEAEPTLRFDFGAIVGTSIEADVTWIRFDRYQVGDGANGPDLTAEVRLEGATDLSWANENARFRWYPLADDVEVLELEADWFNRLCEGEPLDVEFVPSSLNRLLALDARLVSLTFVDGEVTRIRDQRSC